MTAKEGVIDFCHLLNKDFYNYNTYQEPMILKKLELELLRKAFDLFIEFNIQDYIQFLFLIYNKYTYLTLWKPLTFKKFKKILYSSIPKDNE